MYASDENVAFTEMFSAVCGSVCVAFPDKTRENDENRFTTKICFHCTHTRTMAWPPFQLIISKWKKLILPIHRKRQIVVAVFFSLRSVFFFFFFFYFCCPVDTSFAAEFISLLANFLYNWNGIHLHGVRFVVFDYCISGRFQANINRPHRDTCIFSDIIIIKLQLQPLIVYILFYFIASFHWRCLRLKWRAHFIV